MSRREQSIGKKGENLAAQTLRNLGVLMVEKIGTPVRLIPSGHNDNTFRVIYGEKVSGDHRGIMPDGRSVLAECKTILDRNLSWSDLRDHQPERLTEHTNALGLTLLIWVHSSGVYVMEWADVVQFFGPGHPLKQNTAEMVDRNTRMLLESYAMQEKEIPS
jgi:hypothetical protein